MGTDLLRADPLASGSKVSGTPSDLKHFDDSDFDEHLNLEGLEGEFEKQDEEGGHRMMIAIIRQEIGNARD